jgi:hypothetical protein
MLRLLGLIIVFAFTCVGVLLVGDDGSTRIFGLLVTVMGLAWLVVDRMRRRGVL